MLISALGLCIKAVLGHGGWGSLSECRQCAGSRCLPSLTCCIKSLKTVRCFRCPGCKSGLFLQVAQEVAEKLMERESHELGRLLGRLEHPSCSLNVLKVMAPSLYLAVSRGAGPLFCGSEHGKGETGLSHQ